MCKVAVLGANYGMGPKSLARHAGLGEIEAHEVLRRLAQTYPTFWNWADRNIDRAMLLGQLNTVFGWPLHVAGDVRPTSLRNFPMQANGAEMLRLACSIATEAGVDVCAPVHDALLIEAPAELVHDVIAAVRDAMAQASRLVLSGYEISTDAKITSYPDRYADERGQAMWNRVMHLLRHETEVAEVR
jgi:DNA polymerase I-like protein with 3'-5' exonuclease and polymerase domains